MYTVGRMMEDARKIAAEATGRYFLDIALMAAEEALADFHSRDWGFNDGEGAITTIAPYNTGTITLTNNLTTIVGVGTVWDVMWPTPIVVRPSGAAGEAFLVTEVLSTTTATIDRPFPFPTAAAQTYTFEFQSYPISEYIRVQQVCLAQYPWSYPLQLSSMEAILYSRSWWTAWTRPCEFFLVPGDGTTGAALVLNPAPDAVQTIRFRYTKATPAFRCLVGSGADAETGGVASIANAATALTGSSTSWTKLGYSLVGQRFEVPEQDGIYALISAVPSDTSATVAAWGGRSVTDSAYYISPQILAPDDFRPMLRDLMRWKYFQNANEPELAELASQRYQRNAALARTRTNRMRGPGEIQGVWLGGDPSCYEPGRPWSLQMNYSP